jgi:hypothetical protein
MRRPGRDLRAVPAGSTFSGCATGEGEVIANPDTPAKLISQNVSSVSAYKALRFAYVK